MATKKPLVLDNNYVSEILTSDNIGSINGIDFSTTNTPIEQTARLQWDDGNGTLQLGLKGGNVNLQLGQEIVARVFNDSGTNLVDGQIVYISGSQGNRISAKLAKADNEATSKGTLGMVTEPILNGNEGFITILGTVNNLNTSSLTAGNIVYLSPTIAGSYTTTKPDAPNHSVILGYVERVHISSGSIYVKVDNGYEIDELHNVKITSPTDKQILQYNSSLGVWENVTFTSISEAPNDLNAYVRSGLSWVLGYTKSAIDTLLNNKVTTNTTITGATKTKITYDSKGLVTSGSDATTTDISEGTNLYFTESRVRNSLLSGLTASVGTLLSTDTILQAFNKIAGLIDNESWVSWTPTFQGLTVGNGTLDCAYKQIGKTLHCRIMFTLGSTSTVTGGGAGVLYCNLPNGNFVKSSYSIHHPLGLAVLRDTSTGSFVAGTVSIRNQVAGNVDSVKINYTSSSAGLTFSTNNIISTLPFTWAVNDVIQCSFTVEVE